MVLSFFPSSAPLPPERKLGKISWLHPRETFRLPCRWILLCCRYVLVDSLPAPTKLVCVGRAEAEEVLVWVNVSREGDIYQEGWP